MALIVENGTGLATAESYVSVAYATARNLSLGNSTWAGLTTAQMEEALRRATNYMEQSYRLRWAGFRLTDTQALAWPRRYVLRPDSSANALYGYGTGYYAFDAVPVEVQQACSDLALRAAGGDLLADQTQRKSSVTVGPISTSYEAGGKLSTTYAAIDALLRPMLTTGAGQLRMVRQ